uniref:Uncharacterized protein n=1 Tax=Aegilops tauschii TaxID=37682 RepID=M8CUP4_AEGTA
MSWLLQAASRGEERDANSPATYKGLQQLPWHPQERAPRLGRLLLPEAPPVVDQKATASGRPFPFTIRFP